MSNKGCLFIVPTPIGNLGDITFRAVEVLRGCDLLLAEDTRTTGVLTTHYQITIPRQAFHLHNEHRMTKHYTNLLLSGKKIALVSDAGTPGISDAGYLLVRSAVEAKVEVITLPGATALIPALINSSLPCDRFYFEGFLPVKKGRQSRLQAIANREQTVVLYESPHRIQKTLEQLITYCGIERQVSISREISKKFEETLRGSLGEIYTILKERGKLKGELVVCLAGEKNFKLKK